MRAMGFRKIFSFALEGDDVSARRRNRIGGGMIASSSSFETKLVGKENVIACTDCGLRGKSFFDKARLEKAREPPRTRRRASKSRRETA
jgi:hypothetical protein